MGSLLGQLKLTTVSLVNLLDGGLIVGGSVRRYAVVKRTTATHDVDFMIHNIVPNGFQISHQLFLTGLSIKVSHTGIKVVGAHGMSHSLVLVAEFVAVLIMVFTIGYAIADGNQALGQFQIFRISCLAVHLRCPHVVARTDGITRKLGSIVCQEVIEEIGGFSSTFKQGGLPRGAFVDNTCRHKVSEVVGLEIQTRGKGVFLVFSDLDACRILSIAMRVDTRIALRNNHRGMDIAVGTLGQRYLFDETVHQLVQLTVLGHGKHSSTSLEPFVHIAIVEGRTVVLALNGTGSHLEIGKAMTAMLTVFIEHFPGGVPCVPHLPNSSTMHHIKHITPKTARPAGSTHGQVLHLGLLAAVHVGETLGGHVCCCGTATY